jgi:para-aminobenzoate synthetase component I
MSDVKDMIKQMNEFGKRRIPFLFIINFDLTEFEILTPSQAAKKSIFFNFEGKGNFSSPAFKKTDPIEFRADPVSYEHYQKAFGTVEDHIRLGNTYLLNLTFPTRIRTNLTLKEIFERSVSKFRLYYEDQFVVFSPEIFVTIKENKISSFPMKGTIDAAIPGAEKRLMTDEKERAEHNTIVDLIRNDLSMVSKNVRVARFRYVDEIKTHDGELLQTSSEITGDLPLDWNEHIGDILIPLLPAGSVTGAPKNKTVEIISKTEGYDRGFYTGIFGFYDGQKLDSAVMIRFIERSGNDLFFKSGGGITCYSDCKSEYDELIAKVYLPFT